MHSVEKYYKTPSRSKNLLKPTLFFNNFFSKNVDLTEKCWFFRKNCDRILYRFFKLCRRIWKLWNFGLAPFWQKFRESNVLLNKLQKNRFDEIFFQWEVVQRSVEIAKTYFHYFFVKSSRLSEIVQYNITLKVGFTKVFWSFCDTVCTNVEKY